MMVFRLGDGQLLCESCLRAEGLAVPETGWVAGECGRCGDACGHRRGNGAATGEDLAVFKPGDECPRCGCYLGTDGYWYIEADQVPRKEA